MLFEIAKSVEIVIMLGKTAIFPKIVDFIQKHHFVATFVHINLPKSPFFYINQRNLALNIVIMVV